MNKLLLPCLGLGLLSLIACQSKESKYYQAIEELKTELSQQGNTLLASSVQHGYALWIKPEASEKNTDEEYESDGWNTRGMHILRKNLDNKAIDTLAYIDPYSVRSSEPWLSISGDSLALVYEQEGGIGVSSYLIPLKQAQPKTIYFDLSCRAVSDSIYQGLILHSTEGCGPLMFTQEQSYNTSGVCTNKSNTIEAFYHEGPAWFEGLSLPAEALEDKDLRDRHLLHYKSETIDDVFRYANDAKTLESRYSKGEMYRFLLDIRAVERTIDSDNGEPQWLLIGNNFAVISSDPRSPELAHRPLLVAAECQYNQTYFTRQTHGSRLDAQLSAFSMFLSESARRKLELATKISEYPIIFKNSEIIYIP